MKRTMKCAISLLLAVVTVFLCAVPASAYHADGGSVYEYITQKTDNYNRTIYVNHRDTSGNLLKYCEYYTGTLGESDVFGDTILGYDLISFQSNQGVGERCELTWASENGHYGGYGQVMYEFYKVISKKSLTIDMVYEEQDPTTFVIYHFLTDHKGDRSTYAKTTETYA